MTKQDYENRSFEPLPNSAIVYRALLRKNWIDAETGEVKSNAYLLRENEPGLSVRIASACSPEQCAAKFRNCYGVASLEVGSIRELDLEVVQDSISHANIICLPYSAEDRDSAVRLARLLAEQSRVVWRP